MTQKQTRCPECSTLYAVSITQLSIAQGRVCCAKCHYEFNALLHLAHPTSVDYSTSSENAHVSHQPQSEQKPYILEIFNRKIEHSNIDLYTYLNTLNHFNPNTISPPKNLNLAEQIHQPASRGVRYYFMWGLINVILLLALAFQILWFNPQIMQHHPILQTSFYTICQTFQCENLKQMDQKTENRP